MTRKNTITLAGEAETIIVGSRSWYFFSKSTKAQTISFLDNNTDRKIYIHILKYFSLLFGNMNSINHGSILG